MIKKLILTSALACVASNALAGGYVISYEAGLNKILSDDLNLFASEDSSIYKDCLDAGKPLLLKGKFYVDTDAVPEPVESRDYQAVYTSYDKDNFIKYELTIPGTALRSQDPSSEYYCEVNSADLPTSVFVGENPNNEIVASVRRNLGKADVRDDVSYRNDYYDKALIIGDRDVNLNNSGATGVNRFRSVLKADVKAFLGDQVASMISSKYLNSIPDLSAHDFSLDERELGDKHMIESQLMQYTVEGARNISRFQAEILDINVQYVDELDFTGVDCADRLLRNSDDKGYFCL